MRKTARGVEGDLAWPREPSASGIPRALFGIGRNSLICADKSFAYSLQKDSIEAAATECGLLPILPNLVANPPGRAVDLKTQPAPAAPQRDELLLGFPTKWNHLSLSLCWRGRQSPQNPPQNTVGRKETIPQGNG